MKVVLGFLVLAGVALSDHARDEKEETTILVVRDGKLVLEAVQAHPVEYSDPLSRYGASTPFFASAINAEEAAAEQFRREKVEATQAEHHKYENPDNAFKYHNNDGKAPPPLLHYTPGPPPAPPTNFARLSRPRPAPPPRRRPLAPPSVLALPLPARDYRPLSAPPDDIPPPPPARHGDLSRASAPLPPSTRLLPLHVNNSVLSVSWQLVQLAAVVFALVKFARWASGEVKARQGGVIRLGEGEAEEACASVCVAATGEA